ncbi:hypothetical protein B2G71_08515 [Novosphingobium sp. PC22D]|uniref:cupin domain-containing protein n=1 Tax=Novosphingobium sp. PC22D TaxID=1962403 RepID=UPI000BFABA8F|nr:cupin domain-containing protein [Novosphingobium sp. PC22D]PEQ13104.1 hypothetical protein B2G71_08515 [Novosphingobium sp. PC22D]
MRISFAAPPFALLLAACLAGPAVAGEATHPVLVTSEQAEGPIFDNPDAKAGERHGVAFKWFEMLKSADKSSAGVYAAEASNSDIEAYPHDEFMYFLDGSVTLTSADGTVTRVNAGDGVTIPKGWKGNWTTGGYRKFYVIYGGSQ